MSLKFTRAVAKAEGLSRSAKALLIILADVADKRGRSFYRQEHLAELACASLRTVKRALAELGESGWIAREHRQRHDGSRTSDLITVRDLAAAAKHVFDRMQPELWLFPTIDGGRSVDKAVENDRSKVPIWHLGQSANLAPCIEEEPIKKESNRSKTEREGARDLTAAPSRRSRSG